jgi:ABC-type thiamin/hydroxymethylpyrimidine transport system permease subunit
MAWSFLAVGACGVLIGLRFRVPALLVASLAATVASVIAMQFLGFSGEYTFFTTLYLVVTLQGAYVVGLLFAILLRRSLFGRNPPHSGRE